MVEQVGYLVGAFIGTGFITWLLLWLLRNFFTPLAAIIIANVACLLIACTVYDRGFAEGLSIYSIPQAAWLVILLLAERGRKASELIPIVAPRGKLQRAEPHFGDDTELASRIWTVA